MAEQFVYISKNRLVYKDGLRNAYLGEVPEPVLYGQQGKLREHYGVPDSVPLLPATLDHIVAAVGG
ncbi:MAG: hypothetical protein V3V06_01615 [Dehalococcoidia bacterium]